jgi:hypothetical protein
MASDPPDPWQEETDRDFDDIERLTRTVVHYVKAFLIALPLWLLLLLFLPRAGLGEIPSLLAASLIAGTIAVVGARRTRRPDARAGLVRPRRRLGTTGRMTLLGLSVVIVLYLVLVLRAGG